MPGQITCRVARPDDLDAVTRVWLESAREADGAPAEMPMFADLRTRVDVELAHGWDLSVALVEDRIVGMLALKRRDAVLDQLFVSPSMQGHGVGTTLLRRAMEAMPDGFTLRTAAANRRARRFYEHMGLVFLSEGAHPGDGHPVCFYGTVESAKLQGGPPMLSLQEISDRMELAMMLDRYSGAIDRADMDLLDTVFTPDAEIDYTAFAEWGAIKGDYAVIRKWLGERLPHSPGHQHLVANKEIALDGDRATGRIMCLNPMVQPVADAAGRPSVGFHGLWYIDEYVRTLAGWRIARRTEERCFSHNFPPRPAAGA